MTPTPLDPLSPDMRGRGEEICGCQSKPHFLTRGWYICPFRAEKIEEENHVAFQYDS